MKMQADRQEINNCGSSHDMAEGTQGCNWMNTEQLCTINSVLQPLHCTPFPHALCAATQ